MMDVLNVLPEVFLIAAGVLLAVMVFLAVSGFVMTWWLRSMGPSSSKGKTARKRKL